MRDFANDLPTNREMQTRKGLMLIRLLTICKILENSARPKTVVQLREEVNEQMIWNWSEKTFRRDIEILLRLQVVGEIEDGSQMSFSWLGLRNLDSKLL